MEHPVEVPTGSPDQQVDKVISLMGALLTAIMTASLLGFLLLFGPLRRFTRSSICNLCLFGSFMVVAPLINNILGKIDPDSLPNSITNDDFSSLQLMVVYLLILYAGQDNINALSLQDNDAYKRYNVEFLLMNVFFAYLVVKKHDKFTEKICLLWLAMFLKLQERKWAFFYASKAGIARVCHIFADYIKSEHMDQDTQQINIYDPTTLNGYKYLIEPPAKKPLIASPSCQIEIETEKIVTLDHVWQCEGKLLSSDDPDGHLKDLCLSYSFFWLLLQRFAGFTLYETAITEARDKSWRLIRDGLLKTIDNDQVERVFSVIETELTFLYDFFYTKYYAAFEGGLVQFIRRCIIVIIIVSISTLINSSMLTNKFETHVVITVVLRIVMIAATILELIQVMLLITSKWCIVKAICYYVKKQLWKSQWGWYIGKSIKILNLFHTLKPWRRKLGQYSLLENYGYDPCMYRFARLCIKTLIDIPRRGQKQSNNIKLSVEVKVALLSSLGRTNGRKLSNGVESLRRNQVQVQSFYWACKLETQAHVILVWHIATTFCEKKLNLSLIRKQDSMYKNYKVAKDLSRYCAYLVAFAPELLRDHEHVTRTVFDQVIAEAISFFTQGANCCCCCINSTTSMINKMERVLNDQEPDQKINNIERGALLGNRLMANIEDEEKRWKVLAEFWAELVLFLAPSNKYSGHAQYLVKGGELMTHLWALLTHAGIVGTEFDFENSANPPDAERSQV